MEVLSFFESPFGVEAAFIIKEKKRWVIKEKYLFTKKEGMAGFFNWVNSSQKLQQAPVATAVDPSSFFLKALQLPLKNKKQIKKALPFELDEILPIPLADLSMQITVASCKQVLSGANVFLQAIPTSAIKIFEEKLLEEKLSPIHTTTAAQALYRFCTEITEEKTYVAFYQKGNSYKILFTERGRLVSFFSFETDQENSFKEIFEMQRLFYHLKKSLGKTVPILDLSPLGSFAFYEKQIAENLEIEFSKVSIKSEELYMHKNCAIAIGAALDALKEDQDSVCFYKSPLVKKTVTKQAFRLAGVMTFGVLVFILTLFSSLYKEKYLLEERLYQSLILSKDLSWQDQKNKHHFFAHLDDLEVLVKKKVKQQKLSKPYPSLSSILMKLEEILQKEKIKGPVDEVFYEIKECEGLSPSKKKEALFFRVLIKHEPIKEKGKESFVKLFPKEWKQVFIENRKEGYEIGFTIE